MRQNEGVTNVEQLVDTLSKRGCTKIKVAVTDIDGVLRGKYFSLDKFALAAKDGFGFCSVVFGWDTGDDCYEKTAHGIEHSGYPDALVTLDLQTLRYIPWEKNTPFILGNFHTPDQKPLPFCPRQVLKKVVQEANQKGYKTKFGSEFEWYNFRETPESVVDKTELQPLTPGVFGYSILRTSLHQDVFNDIFEGMQLFRVPLEGLHTETGPAVFEAALSATDALEAADRGVVFKNGVKEISLKHKIIASFMAKWHESLPGCSGHLHQSLLDSSGRNLFYDERQKNGMSDIFRSYLAGLLHCIPDLLPMFAPTVNSYKRLVEGFWAPTSPSWGIDNRICALRIIPGKEEQMRVEVRVAGADMNPYLSIAASLAAGLYGIQNNLPLTLEPSVGTKDIYQSKHERFPTTLKEATEKFLHSPIAHSLFGETFVSHFAHTRMWEWKQAHKAVWDWERKRYLEII